ncbi:MAG: putative transposase [Oscillospiraceae bacterium]
MNRVTQDMKFRQSIMIYAGKYNKSRSFIYFWMARYDGTLESLACRSRRPHSHPNQHTPAELKLIRDMRRRNPELGMIELWSRLKKRGYKRCPESLFRVMRRMGIFPAAKPKKKYQPKPYEQMTHPGERIQMLTPFEATAAQLHIRHKLIRPYTPKHNGKVERSHREDPKRFYNKHHFYSLADFENQLSINLRRSNNMPMRPLH